MLLQEFEALTGFYPTIGLYAAIEEAYIEFKGDKVEFCKAYKKNKDGMAEAIQHRANMTRISSDAEAQSKMAGLEQHIQTLRDLLERELEWRPYESKENVSQATYQRLADAASAPNSDVRFMTDTEAKEWLYYEFGFAREKVKIVHEIDVEEVNRHGCIRKTGEKRDRRPIYSATDHHYIRFDTDHWNYEAYNGMLRPFY